MDSMRLAEGSIVNGKKPNSKQTQWMRARQSGREIGFSTAQEFKLFINDSSIRSRAVIVYYAY